MQMELFPISVLEGKNVLQHAAFKGYHANTFDLKDVFSHKQENSLSINLLFFFFFLTDYNLLC